MRGFGFVLVLAGTASMSACVPPTPTPESALAGSWAFLTSAISTELTQFSVVVDDFGFPASATFQLGSEPAATAVAQGTSRANGALASVTCFFGDNNFTIDGTLDASQTTLSGFASLRLQMGNVTLVLSRAPGFLARSSAPVAGRNVMAGTWTLSVPSTQLFETLLQFNAQGQATQVATKIGANPARVDVVPTGTTSVSDGQVAIDLSMFGAVFARDSFDFAGQFTSGGNLLEGTASLRVSAAETTVIVSNTPATLVKLTAPPSGSAALQGIWDYQPSVQTASGSGSSLTQLQLEFDATSFLTRLTYQIDDGDVVTIPGSGGQTDFDGALATVRSVLGADYFLFTGAVSVDLTTMVGYMTAQLGTDTISQQPAIFVKE